MQVMTLVEYIFFGLLVVSVFFLLTFVINWLFRVDYRQRNSRTIIQISHQPPRDDELRDQIRAEKELDEDTDPQRKNNRE